MRALGDIARALGQLGDPAILGVLLKSVLLALALLVAAGWGLGWAVAHLLPETVTLPLVGPVDPTPGWLGWAGAFLWLAAAAVLMMPVAALVVGVFAEEVAAAVERRHYPHLAPARRVGVAETAAETLRFTALVVAVNLVALAVYPFSGPLAPFLFWGVNGALMAREYFHLVAARRLAAPQARALGRRHRAALWAEGMLLAVPLSVPGLGLVVPVVGVAAFTHRFHRLAGAAGL